ncbi:MAG: hypothetical protein WC796_05330 [Candidatus Pacearchaeota archaeon]|jgi:hypothetical protein
MQQKFGLNLVVISIILIASVMFVSASPTIIFRDSFGKLIPENGTALNKSTTYLDIIVDKDYPILFYGLGKFDNVYGVNLKKLCEPCNSGRGYSRTLRLNQGNNFVYIIDGEDFYKIFSNVEFDSKAPLIMKTYPNRNGSSINNKKFYISFVEADPKNVTFNYRKDSDLEYTQEIFDLNVDCQNTKDSNWECSKGINLSDGEISGYFEVNDKLRTTRSRSVSVIIDSTPPVISILSPQNDTANITVKSPLNLMMTLNERSKITYQINIENKKQSLCTSCNYLQVDLRRFFSLGEYKLNITATDKAGNSANKIINVSVGVGPV